MSYLPSYYLLLFLLIRERDRDRDRDRERQREKERQRDREGQRHRERDRETETHTDREEPFQVILMLLEFGNKTISDGHPLLKIRTIFVNLGRIQCYTFLIQGNTCHYL